MPAGYGKRAGDHADVDLAGILWRREGCQARSRTTFAASPSKICVRMALKAPAGPYRRFPAPIGASQPDHALVRSLLACQPGSSPRRPARPLYGAPPAPSVACRGRSCPAGGPGKKKPGTMAGLRVCIGLFSQPAIIEIRTGTSIIPVKRAP